MSGYMKAISTYDWNDLSAQKRIRSLSVRGLLVDSLLHGIDPLHQMA